jgi:aldehyde dehydrogenase (NAD+)
LRDYLKMHVDGAWVDSDRAVGLDVTNPANEKIAGRISLGTPADEFLEIKAVLGRAA